MADIAHHLQHLQQRISRAAARAGRDPSEIILIGAAKQVDAARLRQAVEAGLQHVGENYVQEALPKIEALGRTVTWHFLGHLQTNKIRHVVGAFDYVHSLDRIDLLEALERRALQKGITMSALIEVNLAGEASKTGTSVETAEQIIELSRQSAIRPSRAQSRGNPPVPSAVEGQSAIPIVGLMTMPPPSEDPEQSRRYFAELRTLREVWRNRWEMPELRHLSMGMSADFEVAIEEGATMVRVGTALFGKRQ